MANSKYVYQPALGFTSNDERYDYVKAFEASPRIMLNTYMVVRIDGRGFHKLSSKYEFHKPNDRRALDLMNAAAVAVLQEVPDIRLAYGISDEYSFILDRSCTLFDRRESKLLTTIVSTFTSYYTFLWSSNFPEKPLSAPMPSFDGRIVGYPTFQNLRDYMSWRQVDCHINNLYNTVFWALVQQGGIGNTEAEEQLKGTLKADKQEILFSRFGINYNDEPDIFKKGSVVYRNYNTDDGEHQSSKQRRPDTKIEISKTQREKERKRRTKAEIVVSHVDLIKDDFWISNPWLFSDSKQ